MKNKQTKNQLLKNKNLLKNCLKLLLMSIASKYEKAECVGFHREGPFERGNVKEQGLIGLGAKEETDSEMDKFTIQMWFKTPILSTIGVDKTMELFEILATDGTSRVLALFKYSTLDSSWKIQFHFSSELTATPYPLSALPSGNFLLDSQKWYYANFQFYKESGLNYFKPYFLDIVGGTSLNPALLPIIGANILESDKFRIGESSALLTPTGSHQTFSGTIYSFAASKISDEFANIEAKFMTRRTYNEGMWIFRRADYGSSSLTTPITYKNQNKFGVGNINMILHQTSPSLTSAEAGSNVVLKLNDYLYQNQPIEIYNQEKNPVKAISVVAYFRMDPSATLKQCQDSNGNSKNNCKLIRIKFTKSDGTNDGEIIIGIGATNSLFIIVAGEIISTEKNLLLENGDLALLVLNIGFLPSNKLWISITGTTNGIFERTYYTSQFSITNQGTTGTTPIRFEVHFGNISPETDDSFLPMIPQVIDIYKSASLMTGADPCGTNAEGGYKYSHSIYNVQCQTGFFPYIVNHDTYFERLCGDGTNPGFYKQFKFMNEVPNIIDFFRQKLEDEYIDAEGYLMKCSSECQTCEGRTNIDCTSCQIGKHLSLDANPSKPNLGKCVDFTCHSTCKTCNQGFFNSSVHCLSCLEGYELSPEGEGECLKKNETQNNTLNLTENKDITWEVRYVKKPKMESQDIYIYQIYSKDPRYGIDINEVYTNLKDLFSVQYSPQNSNISMEINYEIKKENPTNIEIQWKLDKDYEDFGILTITITNTTALYFSLRQEATSTIENNTTKRVLLEDITIPFTKKISVIEVEPMYRADSGKVSLIPSKPAANAVSSSTKLATVAASAAMIASSFTSFSLIYLAKLIQFLEFVSYLVFINAAYVPQIQTFLWRIYEIVNYDLIENFNSFFFNSRENAQGYFNRGRIGELGIGVFLHENASFELWILLLVIIVTIPALMIMNCTHDKLKVKRKEAEKRGEVFKRKSCGFWEGKIGRALVNLKFSLVMMFMVDYIFFVTSNMTGFVPFFTSKDKKYFGGLTKDEVISTTLSMVLGWFFVKEIYSYYNILNNTVIDLNEDEDEEKEKEKEYITSLEAYRKKVVDSLMPDFNKEVAVKYFFCRNFTLLYMMRFQLILIIMVSMQNFPTVQLMICFITMFIFVIFTYYYQIRYNFIEKKLSSVPMLVSELMLFIIIGILLTITIKKENNKSLTTEEIKYYSSGLILAFTIAVFFELICNFISTFIGICCKQKKKKNVISPFENIVVGEIIDLKEKNSSERLNSKIGQKPLGLLRGSSGKVRKRTNNRLSFGFGNKKKEMKIKEKPENEFGDKIMEGTEQTPILNNERRRYVRKSRVEKSRIPVSEEKNEEGKLRSRMAELLED